ncbi:MAG: zinc-binding dehydrogenase [Ignavibacteriales bacterium]|nr:zinc-binding dehydrogenase [Ignavibacteriales bacterium]
MPDPVARPRRGAHPGGGLRHLRQRRTRHGRVDGRRRPPVVMGHEAAGTIAGLGPGVKGWEVGDRVTFDSTIWCGECWHCRRGEINLCDDRRVLGVSCAEYRRDGAFAELVAVPARILYRLPPACPSRKRRSSRASPSPYMPRSALPRAPGATCLVVGAGTIGLLAVQALKALGCGTVAAADVAPERLALARRLGADLVIDTRDTDAAAEMRKLTSGRGADAAIEAVGLGTTVSLAVGSLRKGGTVVLVGNLSARCGPGAPGGGDPRDLRARLLRLARRVSRLPRVPAVRTNLGEAADQRGGAARGRRLVVPAVVRPGARADEGRAAAVISAR